MSPKAYSTFLMMLQIAAALAYLVGGFCGDKFGKRPSMAVFSFLSAVTLYVWLGMEWEDTMFFVWGASAWIVASAIWAILSAYLVEQFPTNIRAVGVAAGFSTGRLIATIVPLAMGAAAQHVGLTSVMTAMAVFYLICMFGVLMLRDSKVHI
jgi:MFS family permease